MQNHLDIGGKTQDLRDLFKKQFGIRSASFEKAVRRAGRDLPRNIRSSAAVLIEAERMAQHPKLARRIDSAGVEAAYRDIANHLESIDLSAQRSTRFLNMLAGMVAKVLLICGLVVLFIWWRGLI